MEANITEVLTLSKFGSLEALVDAFGCFDAFAGFTRASLAGRSELIAFLARSVAEVIHVSY
jgi:hypothetical protein